MSELEQLLKKIISNKKRRDNRLLKSLEPWELWNEFSQSNLRLHKYDSL